MEHETAPSTRSDSTMASSAMISLANPLIVAMAPLVSRPALGVIAAFDGQMADFARRTDAAEIMLTQLRLAWWREEIVALDDERVRPDPLLAQLAGLKAMLPDSALLALLDAWEALLLAQPFDLNAAVEFARQRGEAVFALADAAIHGADAQRAPCGTTWAVVDLALNVSDKSLAHELFLTACDWPEPPRTIARPLYALDRWARQVAAKRGERSPWSEQAMLLRIGLIGR